VTGLESLSKEQQLALLQIELDRRKRRIACEQSLSEFFKFVWEVLEPGRELKWGWSIDLMCRFLEDFSLRKFKRGIINIPPRGTKSLLVSVAFPLWVWIQSHREARYGGPGHQFLTLAHSDGLATRDAVKSRTVLESPEFQAMWGDRIQIRKGQNEKANYELNENGHRNSFGLQSMFMGRGGDTIIIDDPNDPEKVYSDTERANVIEAYTNKVVSRLNDRDNGGIIIIMQRLHELDLTGFVISAQGLYDPDTNPRGWMQLVLPMEYELDSPDDDDRPVNPAGKFGYEDPRCIPGELMMPERFPKDAVDYIAEKEYMGRDTYGYTGQFQQRPAPAAGGILKKNHWHKWPESLDLPYCDHVFLSWDTAFSEKDAKSAAYSAMTAWGVFYNEQMGSHALMLLGAWWDMASYPELKKLVREKEEFFNPDAHLIEKASSGHSLLQELKRTHTKRGKRVLLRAIKPRQLGDKVSRAHTASSLFAGGMVFVPSPAHVSGSRQINSDNLKWVKDVINYVGVFPNGAPPCKDITDTVTQAIIYLQRGWWVNHPDDEKGMNYVGSEDEVSVEDEDNDWDSTDEMKHSVY